MSVTTQLSELWAQVHSPSGLPFPSTVSRLLSLGVTRYHIDYVSLTATSYISTPTSPTTAFKSDIAKLPAEHLPAPLTATEFNKAALVAAIRKAQAMAIEGKSDYLGFAKECVQAGVTDYVAFLEGKNGCEAGDAHGVVSWCGAWGGEIRVGCALCWMGREGNRAGCYSKNSSI